jgi:hypothetical protein
VRERARVCQSVCAVMMFFILTTLTLARALTLSRHPHRANWWAAHTRAAFSPYRLIRTDTHAAACCPLSNVI